MSAMAGRATVSVSTSMGMMVENLGCRVLNQDKTGKHDQCQDQPPL